MSQFESNHLRHIALEVLLNDVKTISYDGRKIRKFAQSVPPTLFVEIINHLEQRLITRFSLYTLLTVCNKNRDINRTLKSFLDEHNMHAINDEKQLEEICSQTLQENPKQMDRYKTNPKKALEQLHSYVCKKYYGRLHDDAVDQMFKRLLEKK